MQRAIYLRNRNSGIMFQSFGKGVPGRSKFLHKRKTHSDSMQALLYQSTNHEIFKEPMLG